MTSKDYNKVREETESEKGKPKGIERGSWKTKRLEQLQKGPSRALARRK